MYLKEWNEWMDTQGEPWEEYLGPSGYRVAITGYRDEPPSVRTRWNSGHEVWDILIMKGGAYRGS